MINFRLRRSNPPEYISAPAVLIKNIWNDYGFQRSMTSSKKKKETAEDINVSHILIVKNIFLNKYSLKLYNKYLHLSNWQQRRIEEAEYKNALAQANSVMNIKVYWRQMGTYRFPLRMVRHFFY